MTDQLRRAGFVLVLAIVVMLQAAACGLTVAPVDPPAPPLPAPAPTVPGTWESAPTVSSGVLLALEGDDPEAVEAIVGRPFDAYVEVDPPHADVRSYRVLVDGHRRFVHVRFVADKAVGPIEGR